MGKRKSKARVMKKERASVDTIFDCPFCNHKQTVECKMNYTTNLGNIKCRVCAVSFQSDIHRTIALHSDEQNRAQRATQQRTGRATHRTHWILRANDGAYDSSFCLPACAAPHFAALLCAGPCCPPTDLSDPIDVYSEWIDSCESINKKVAEHRDMGEQDPYEEQLGAGDESD